ncbi:sn-glycerol-3-phosphate ABC transporter ATP-binding protein UgpC [Pelagibacterium sp. H642]|uniref:ABC transporter ATP-binding protein n=1 Tax=Pelagibacterium sp. H642 TaxID=1881069 RepID=UPI002815FEAB|nr:sn-glycerol-3-phosphate ABC transporter ATP-binding protein UgpC [Pelagibacterium sp. H642]WMT89803.1 sn-glycerol-3-phosphate ABC transporter ATP-binding protein UgpC [Pelagibacterium sp. H642]
MAQIELKDVRKSYGATPVIHGISLGIEQGEFVVFVGPSGCGKSTLLRMIAGLETITDGDLYIGGKRMNDEEPSDRGVAMVFQSYALYPHMSVADNMSFGLRMTGRPKAEIAEKVQRAASILQLEKLLDRKPAQLSGGQRQRVAIGRAIVRNPDVFLFDEPLSNLDAELRVQMRVEIAKLHGTLGNTMIYVTHDQTEAVTLADRIVVLRAGVVEQVGTPMELYENPDNAFVAGFIGSPRMNFLSATASGPKQVTLNGIDVALPHLQSDLTAGQALQLGVRPEHLDAPAGIELPVSVDVSEQLGSTTYVHSRLADGEVLIAERRGSAPRSGEATVLRFDPASVRLFDQAGARVR